MLLFLVLEEYKKYKRETKKSLIDVIKEISRLEKSLLFALIVCVVGSLAPIYLGFTNQGYLIAFFSFLAEVCITFYISRLSTSVTTVGENLKDYKKNLKKTRNWLFELGFTKKEELCNLCVRYQKMIAEKEKQVNDKKKHIEKILCIIIIPSGFLIISASKDVITDLAALIEIIFLGAFFSIIIYVFCYGVCGIIDRFIYYDYNLTKSMVDEFEDIIDFDLMS